MARFLTLALAGLLTTAPVVALEQAGNTVKLTDAEMTDCREGGGCVVIPRAVLAGLLKHAQETANCGAQT